jgi:hypothetical protein
MVKITNGISTYEVTKGAFENVFKNQGYFTVKDKIESTSDEDLEYGKFESKPEVTDEDKAFVDEVSEKPISQWSKTEVKRFASIKNIDLSGTASVSEAKDRIKVYLK